MKLLVVYYSKSGNTKSIADVMAQNLHTEALPLNLMEKKGRGTEEEREKEKEFFNCALEASTSADLVLIGTPTSFKQAHSKVTRFTKAVEAKNAGLFCTHYKKIGTTLTDLEVLLKERGIPVVGSCEFGGLTSGQFKELDTSTREEYMKRAEEFAKKCARHVEGGK